MPTPTGPGDALAQLMKEHDGRLRALAGRLLGDSDLVDDALQETYIRALRALPRFRQDAAIGTWLYRITHNVCMDELRRRRRRAEEPYEEEAVPATARDTVDLAAARADVAAGLASLPAAHRAAVVLVDCYGMDYQAAADALGIPAGTVGSRVFRARASLRQTLAVQAA